MRYRTALIATAVFVAAMFALKWCAFAAAQWGVSHAWEYPVWFRFLLNAAAFWNVFWFHATIVVLTILLAIASLTAALHGRRAR